ncbi:MAG TPA: hypothetical protein VKF14_15205 [Candidatus Dormibacteraeota bacterium]|nr:hypothetical protein [Candidatus Dormibacteraeota bacterium]
MSNSPVWTEVDGEVSVGHGGGSPGTVALLRVHPSRQLALAVCLNSTESAAAFFADFIGGWLAATFGTPAWRNPVPPEQTPALDLAAYEGAYRRSAMTHRLRFRRRPPLAAEFWPGRSGRTGDGVDTHHEQRFLYRRPGQARYAMLHFLDFDGSRPRYVFDRQIAPRVDD